MKKKILFIIFILVAVAISIYYSYPLNISLTSVSQLLIDKPYVIIAILFAIFLQFIGHWIRAVKQKMILEQIRPVKVIEILKGQTIGSLFNSILPFRLGELFRAHYVAKGVSISRSAVFATILFERLLDAIIMIILGFIMLFTINKNSMSLLNVIILLIILSVLLGFVLYSARSQKKWLLEFVYHVSSLFNQTIQNRIRFTCWSAIYSLKNTITRKIFPRYFAITCAMWVSYLSSTLILIIFLFGSLLNPSQQIIAAISAYFGVSIPSGPAYLGSFQKVFSSISTVSSDLLHTNNITLVLWVLLIIPTAILGIYFIFRPQKIYAKKDINVISALKNKLYRDIDITNDFAQFLDAYFRGSQINRILTAEELANNFQVIKTFTGGSNALTLLAWQNERMVVKKITLKQFEDKLISQYNWLKERENLPEIAKIVAEYSDNSDYYAIDVEYKDTYIPYFDIIHSSSSKISCRILMDVCNFVDKKIYTPVTILDKEVGSNLLNKYIESKIVGKITDASITNIPISNLLAYKTIIINGQKYNNFNSVIDAITSNKQAMSDLASIHESPIHGDLTVDNIIVNPADNKYVILDPNNENVISDPVVDYGKLMQSVHSGYEFLRSLSSCTIIENSIGFEEIKSVQYNRLYNELVNYLKEKLPPERYKTIVFHEAVHYCRMLPYRVNINPDTAAAFYCIAIRLFNEFLEQYKNE